MDPQNTSSPAHRGPHAPQLPRTRLKRGIAAWREWRLIRPMYSHELLLGAITANWLWPGPVMHAKSTVTEDPASLGLHAWKLAYARPNPMLFTVRGHVLLYGTVVEHEYGFRAQHAVIQDLTLCYAENLWPKMEPTYCDEPVQPWYGRYVAEIRAPGLNPRNARNLAAELSNRYECPVSTLDITPLGRELWASENP